MKNIIIISAFILGMVSCHSSNNEITIPEPDEKVTLNIANETFIVDFKFNAGCELNMSNWDLSEPFAKLETKDDLFDFYKTSHAPFQHGASSLITSYESVFAMLEYKLAQECFSDNCDSEYRKEVLQLAANFQKQKYREYSVVDCAKKSGVFLIAIILAKEWENSAEFIDSKTLQQALLYLSNDKYVSEDFSDLIIECSERFLTNSKN